MVGRTPCFALMLVGRHRCDLRGRRSTWSSPKKRKGKGSLLGGLLKKGHVGGRLIAVGLRNAWDGEAEGRHMSPKIGGHVVFERHHQ